MYIQRSISDMRYYYVECVWVNWYNINTDTAVTESSHKENTLHSFMFVSQSKRWSKIL